MNVGIIGGGAAGLLTAWLLDKDCNVILFEQQDRLGGHAHTVYVSIDETIIPIEAAFEFFSSGAFPHLCRLLKILEVPIRSYPVTYTFYTKKNNDIYVLPPVYRTNISWKTLNPSRLFNILQLKYALDKGHQIINSGDTTTTLEQFADRLMLTSSFKNNFFYPFLAGGWGLPVQDFKTFAAYDILTWVIDNSVSDIKPYHWYEIIDGTAEYIKALIAGLSKTQIKLSTKITQVDRSSAGYTIRTTDGSLFDVDHLIVATSSYQAQNLLKSLQEARAARDALGMIDYFRAHIAIHGDPTFLPKDKADWSIINVCYEGTYSCITVHKPWKTKARVFRSWLVPEAPLPQPLYSLQHYYHPKVNAAYFKAQKLIQSVQGHHNIWFAGMYTKGIDSHESAITSALSIARQLAPDSDRLSQFVK